MIINAEVEKKKNENNMSILKRFTRRVQESGALRRVRSIRYLQRNPSEYTRKKNKLNSLKKKKEIDLKIKLGKISEITHKRGRR